MEENFLLLFRFDNPLESSVEFMKVTVKLFASSSLIMFLFIRFGGNMILTVAAT